MRASTFLCSADYLVPLRHCQGGIGSLFNPHNPSPFSLAIRSSSKRWSFFRYRRYAQAWPSDTISWLIFRSPTKISAIILSYRSTPDTLATINLLATFFESAREACRPQGWSRSGVSISESLIFWVCWASVIIVIVSPSTTLRTWPFRLSSAHPSIGNVAM